MNTVPLSHPGKLFIDGAWVDPRGGGKDLVVNPATGEAFATAPCGSVSDVEDAIASARHAFDHGPWPRLSGLERAAVLQRFHDELLTRKDGFVSLLIDEAGSTAQIAEPGQFLGPLAHLRFAIANAARPLSTSFPPVVAPHLLGGQAVNFNLLERGPVGVVAAIAGYNFPFALAIWKVAAGLAMGNTVILKPSPFTSLLTLYIAEAAAAAGIPPGVLNIVTGDKAAAEMLTTDPRIDMVSFTGSDTVGSAIMAQAAPTLKRLLLELGGKSAMIVTEDADLDQAAVAGAFNFTLHAGQVCAITTLQIVHNSVRQRYVEKVAAIASAIKVGDPRDPTVQMGPLIRESQRARVERYVAEAKSAGGEMVLGGARPEGLGNGFFYKPTLFNGVDPASPIAQDEIFGPIGVVLGFDTDEEAIALANGTHYGLAGAVFAGRSDRALRIARAMRTGAVHVNCIPAVGGDPSVPMGGIKRSGIGLELGIEGLLSYTVPKNLVFEAR